MSPGALWFVLLQLLLTEYRFPNPSACGWVRTFPNHRFHVEVGLELLCATCWGMAHGLPRGGASCLGGAAALDRGAVRLDAVWGFSVLSWVLRGDMDTQTVGAMETLSAMLTTGALPFARRGRRCGRAFHMALMFL